MTYDEAIEWLFVQLPMYQRMGKAAYKADLVNTLKVSYLFRKSQKLNLKAFM